MRIPNPRLIRLGGLTRGAIIEPGDGELIVSPLVQPVTELASPIVRCFPAPIAQTQLFDDSYVQYASAFVNGAGAGTIIDFLIMSRGKWSFDLTFVSQFTGASNSSVSYLFLQDPAGNITRIFQGASVNGTAVALQGRFDFTFQDDNFQFRLANGATAINDVISTFASVNARRVL